MFLRSSLLALVALAVLPGAAKAAKSYDSCTGFIDSLPATISTQGTWCLRKDLTTAITSGIGIQVLTNNVTIDCNEFKLNNLQASPGTAAYGIKGEERTGVTVRNCNIRGFKLGVSLPITTTGGNHLVENNRFLGATYAAVLVYGDGSVVRNNLISDIGGTTTGYDQPKGIIVAYGAVDVLDNTIYNVWGGAHGSYGISLYQIVGGTVNGNRIRNIVASGGPQELAITTFESQGVLIQGNDIAGPGEFGIDCENDKGRVRDNVINGFHQSITACGDAGGNDITSI